MGGGVTPALWIKITWPSYISTPLLPNIPTAWKNPNLCIDVDDNLCPLIFFHFPTLFYFFAQQLSRRYGWFSENNFLSCFFCNQLFCKWNKECLVSDFVTQTILTSHFVEWNKSCLLSLLKLCSCKLICE